jgi:poly(A) polymerase
MTEREFALTIVKRLQDAGHQALWAGGCVRDELLHREPDDYDVATDARPETIRKLFRPTVAVGESFGVINVIGPRTAQGHPLSVEVATFRSDLGYTDGRHPDRVVFSTPEEDAKRRDFTVNGMFFDPIREQLLDYVGGRADLEAHILRAIGDPHARFQEDKLRLLRAVRIAACFNLEIEPATRAALPGLAPQIRTISAERIAAELKKLLVNTHRSRGVQLLRDLGLAAVILPEILEMVGLPQGLPASPTGDLWEHVLRVLDLLGTDVSFPLAMAALLHDVGKRRTVGRTPERYTFYSHEEVSRRMAGEICLRLKLSNAERERIEWLVKKHQFLCNASQLRPSKLKETLGHPGIQELLQLHRADALASGRPTDSVDFCEDLLKKWSERDLHPAPFVTGHDLSAMGLEPGPRYKELLDKVREAQMDGTINTRDEALAMLHKLAAEDISPLPPAEGQGEGEF